MNALNQKSQLLLVKRKTNMDIGFAQPQINTVDGILKWDITPAEERAQLFKEAALGFVLGTVIIGFLSLSYGFTRTTNSAKEIIANLIYAPIIAGAMVVLWAIFRLLRSGTHRFYEMSDAGVILRTPKQSHKYLWADFESYSDPDEKYTNEVKGDSSSGLSGALQIAQDAKSMSRPLYYLRLRKRFFWLPIVKLIVLNVEPEVASAATGLLEKHLPKKQLIGLQLYRIIY